MIVLLDTHEGVCRIGLVLPDDQLVWHEWQADRQLAHGLLTFMRDCLAQHGAVFQDITGLATYAGPGSFTGLRIGLTVMNTLSDSLGVPIVGATGEAWVQTARDRLRQGENDVIVMPEYGAAAHITKPRK